MSLAGSLDSPHIKSPYRGKTAPRVDLYIVFHRTKTGSDAACQSLTLIPTVQKRRQIYEYQVRSIDVQALSVESHIRVHCCGVDYQKMAGDIPPFCKHIAYGHRRWQRARGGHAPCTAWNPLPTQDAAASVFRVCVESIWVLMWGLPLWSARQLTPERQDTLIACLMGVALVPLVMPWG